MNTPNDAREPRPAQTGEPSIGSSIDDQSIDQSPPKCRARRTNGQPCGRYPTRGAAVCRSHGAGARHVRVAAQRRLARAEAVKELNALGKPVLDADPGAMVLREVSHAAGHVDLLRGILGALDPHTAVQGSGRPYWDAYADERARLTKFSDLAARLGLAERQTLLAERVAGLVAALMTGVVAELDLTPAQHALAAVVLPARLRELQSSLELEGASS